jgi:DNA-binding transcriptional ArsR family regulator
MLKQYEPAVGDVDLVFHALADASRRAMVERLTHGPASVSELARPLAMSLPAVVQHLHVLEASGLVHSRKLGRVRTCTVAPAALRSAEHWIAERRTFWEQSLDQLGEYLAREEPSQQEPREEPSHQEPREEPSHQEPREEPSHQEPREEPSHQEPREEHQQQNNDPSNRQPR